MKKFESMEQAWRYINLTFGKFEKDEQRTERAGYSVYRNEEDSSFYICDLNDRLELNYANGKSENYWIDKYTNILFFVETIKTGYIREFEYHNELIRDIRFWWASGEEYSEIEQKIEKTIDYLLSIDYGDINVEFIYSGLKFTIKHI